MAAVSATIPGARRAARSRSIPTGSALLCAAGCASAPSRLCPSPTRRIASSVRWLDARVIPTSDGQRRRMEWWKNFFDAEYLRLWSELTPPSRSEQEAEGLWSLLRLERGSRVLDAPCGFGRLSRELALRGARVVGVDLSRELL